MLVEAVVEVVLLEEPAEVVLVELVDRTSTPTGGATNTGSGGGGSTSNVVSGAGADGIVII